MAGEQSGAVGACWAHNPEVGRSKLLSAKTFFTIHNSRMMKSYCMSWKCVLITKFIFYFALRPCWKPKFWFQHFTWNQLKSLASDTFLCQKLMCTDFTTILRPASGVLLQWRNRLARRTYKQYLPKRCGGCEFEPHLEHVFSSKYLSKSPWMILSPHPVATVYVWQQFPCRIS